MGFLVPSFLGDEHPDICTLCAKEVTLCNCNLQSG